MTQQGMASLQTQAFSNFQFGDQSQGGPLSFQDFPSTANDGYLQFDSFSQVCRQLLDRSKRSSLVNSSSVSYRATLRANYAGSQRAGYVGTQCSPRITPAHCRLVSASGGCRNHTTRGEGGCNLQTRQACIDLPMYEQAECHVHAGYASILRVLQPSKSCS